MKRLFTGEVQKYGFEKGKLLGLAEGRSEGRAEGEAKKQNEIAKKMKDEGAEIEFIVRVTGLSKEEVEAL